MSWQHLNNDNSAYPMNNAFSGGSYATPQMAGNSLLKMFSPGGDLPGPTMPILDPFTGKHHTRFEVPDTASVVNLGEVVLFKMQSNNESFMTREILPIVPWGWAVRTFAWGVWNFPQFPVRPTPETAPPRFLSSYKFNETSTLHRFAIGHHMSTEYAKTTMGKANQQYNLQQIEYSVQECLNNEAVKALHNCHYQNRARMEKMNQYSTVDIEKAMCDEVTQFAMTIKREHGFQLLYEAINRKLNDIGGNATAIITTDRINTLVLTKPELIEYYRAGPKGPALLDSPNRTFLPNGIMVYYTKTYPERFGTNVSGLWQRVTQIGNYHKSMELPAIRGRDINYFEKYTSDLRNISIYDQESDAIHTIDVTTLLNNSYIFDYDGNLRDVDNPPPGAPGTDPGFGDDGHHDHGPDFLSFDKDDLDDDYNGSNNNSGRNNPPPNSLEVFGQLRKGDFTPVDVLETGSMLACRLATRVNMDVKAFNTCITKGLKMYSDMCKRDIDMEFITLVLKVFFKTKYETKRAIVLQGPFNARVGNIPGHLNRVWVDLVAATMEDVFNNITTTAIMRTPDNVQHLKIRDVKSVEKLVPPLPTQSSAEYPDFEGKKFGNLTGYASYHGFKAMAELYRNITTVVQERYMVEELRIASEFIDAIEGIAEFIDVMLPGCKCFESKGSVYKGEIIAEQLMNMVGFPLWINAKKAGLFIMNQTTHDNLDGRALNNPVLLKAITHVLLATDTGGWDTDWVTTATNVAGGGGVPIRNFVAARDIFGEFYEEYVRAGLKRYYASEDGGPHVFETFWTAMSTRLKSMKGVDYTVNYTALTGDASKLYCDLNANYAADTPDLMLALLNDWIHPTLRRGFGHRFGVGGGDTTLATLANAIAAPHPTAQLVYIGDTVTVSQVNERCNGDEVMGLALSKPDVSYTLLHMFGPLRLCLFQAVLDAALLAAQYLKNDKDFLEALMILNLLMLPFSRDVNLAGGRQRDFAFLLYGNSAAAGGGGVRAADTHDPAGVGGNVATTYNLDGYYSRSDSRARETAAMGVLNAHAPFNTAGVGLTRIRGQLPKILDHIFKNQPDGVIALVVEIKQNISEAEAEEQALNMTGKLGLAGFSDNLPFLEGISDDPKQNKVHVPLLAADTNNAIVTEIFFTEETNHISRMLGLTWRDQPDNFSTQVPLAIIGGPQKRKKNATQQQSSPADISELIPELKIQSFVKTGLYISSDQIHFLIQKNSPNQSRPYFDLRVGSFQEPKTYIAYDYQDTFLNEIQGIQHAYQTNRGMNRTAKDLLCLPVDTRMRSIHIAGSSGGRTEQDISVGSRIKIHMTKSFKETCRSLELMAANHLDRLMALFWMCTPFTEQACKALISHNVRLPINFLVVRPHANYLMETCAMLTQGIDNLGFTAVAGTDYVWSSSVLTKEFNGHLSFWANCIVTKPQNCVIVRNVVPVGYGPGGGVEFFSPKNYDPSNLGEHRKPTQPSRSLICLPIPFTENVTRNYICTSGKLPHVEEGHGGSTSILKPRDQHDLHYRTAKRANRIWRWTYAVDSNFMDTLGANGTYPLYNKICYSGMTFYSNIPTLSQSIGGFTHMTTNKGHWGSNQGPGCQAVYSGIPQALPNFNYETSGKYTIVS